MQIIRTIEKWKRSTKTKQNRASERFGFIASFFLMSLISFCLKYELKLKTNLKKINTIWKDIHVPINLYGMSAFKWNTHYAHSIFFSLFLYSCLSTRDQQIEVHLKCTKRALWFICRCLQTNFYIYFFLFWLDYLFTIFRISFAFITDPIHTLIKIILCNHVTKTAWYFPFFFSSTAMFEYNSTIAIENIEQKKNFCWMKRKHLMICMFVSFYLAISNRSVVLLMVHNRFPINAHNTQHSDCNCIKEKVVIRLSCKSKFQII